ncbi:aspartic peptidase domain-containing protein [Phycomyces nitens]|nr:aspartic peptidase domain-containing protein [Phycomyces nitens]
MLKPLVIKISILSLALTCLLSQTQALSSPLRFPLTQRQRPDKELEEYGITVSVGTPPTDFLLIFDTGSADTWLPSSACTPKAGCPSNRKYNPTKSSTYVRSTIDYSIDYYSADVNGSYFNDTVKFGGFTLENQFIGLVKTMTGSLTDQTGDIVLDGVFGAGIPGSSSLSIERNETYLTMPMDLYAKGLIPEPLFSVFLGQQDLNGEVIFGAIDHKRASTPIIYVDVALFEDVNGYTYFNRWYSSAYHIEVGSEHIEIENAPSTPFVFDTGTNSIALPTYLADKVTQGLVPDAVKNGTIYNVDCSYLNSTRPFRIVFPGAEFAPHQPKNLNVTLELPVSKMVVRSGSTCRLIVESDDNSFPVLGNLFLRHFITVFDFGNYVIGISPLKH